MTAKKTLKEKKDVDKIFDKYSKFSGFTKEELREGMLVMMENIFNEAFILVTDNYLKQTKELQDFVRKLKSPDCRIKTLKALTDMYNVWQDAQKTALKKRDPACENLYAGSLK